MKIGECNHCGKCCLSIKLGGLMLENPCIELGEDRCKFYVDELQEGKYGHCLILGRRSLTITSVKDRLGNKITKAQIKWFEQNCPDYPTEKDIESGHKLLPECSFSFEAVADVRS